MTGNIFPPMQTMVEWLLQVCERLIQTSQLSLSRRLICGTAVVLCILEVKKDELSLMQTDAMLKLCQLITLKPLPRVQEGPSANHPQTRECLEYMNLCSELVSDDLR